MIGSNINAMTALSFPFRSLHPPELTSLLLDHTLSSPLGPAHESSFTNLSKVLAHLAQTHRHAVRVFLVRSMGKLLAGETAMEGGDGGDGRLMKMFLLLKLLTSCRPLLDVVAEDILDQGGLGKGREKDRFRVEKTPLISGLMKMGFIGECTQCPSYGTS